MELISNLIDWLIATAPYIVVGAIIVASILIYAFGKNPVRGLLTILLVLGVWIVSMPSGIDAARTVWSEDSLQDKRACARILASDLAYWTWEADPRTACSSTDKSS